METQMEIMAHKENEVKSHQLLFHIHTHEKALNSENGGNDDAKRFSTSKVRGMLNMYI